MISHVCHQCIFDVLGGTMTILTVAIRDSEEVNTLGLAHIWC